MGGLEAAPLPVRGLSFWRRGRWALLCVRVTATSVSAGGGQSTSRWHPARPGPRSGLSQAAPHGPVHASRVMLHVLSFGVSVPRPELWIPLRSWAVRSQPELAPGRSLAPGSLPHPVLSEQTGLWCSLFFRKRKSPFSQVLPKYLGKAILAGMNDKV